MRRGPPRGGALQESADSSDNPSVRHCDNCGGPLRLERDTGLLVCDHCGSSQAPAVGSEQIEFLAETATPCPLCTTVLSSSRLTGHPLLCCAHCFGMLIEMSRFAAIVDAARSGAGLPNTAAQPFRERPGDRILSCPTCRQPMLSQYYAGPGNVVIDSCETCQVNWLDSGELRRIATAPSAPYSG